MINGAHSIIYSTDPVADRAFFRDVLKLPNVDVGGGWVIFGLPPAEVAVHPAGQNDVHELFLMCENLDETIDALAGHEIHCSEIESPNWGRLTRVTLPGGGTIGLYQPSHARPEPAG